MINSTYLTILAIIILIVTPFISKNVFISSLPFVFGIFTYIGFSKIKEQIDIKRNMTDEEIEAKNLEVITSTEDGRDFHTSLMKYLV